MEYSIENLKKSAGIGFKASETYEYIKPLLNKYKTEIFKSLENCENIEKLHGMAFIMRKIENDILKDIAHGEDAFNLLKNKNIKE